MAKRYSYNDEDMKVQQLLPELLGKDKTANLKRFVTAPNLSYRAGFARLEETTGFESFYWYDEFWCVIQGKGEVTTINRATSEKQNWNLESRDIFFIPKGDWVSIRASSKEPLVFFYCAIPAASLDAPWLAHMTKEDIFDVVKRREY
jgi:mannose-6-phosphate isomerase-like protein (cupin superfamily)